MAPAMSGLFQLIVISSGNVRRGHSLAGWQSGYAAACKAVDGGSIPPSASIFRFKLPQLIIKFRPWLFRVDKAIGSDQAGW